MHNNSMFWSVLKGFFTQRHEREYSKKNKSVTFENNGRSGYAIYREGNITTRFYTEVGGGDCILYMVIPSRDEWELQTRFTLEKRDEILSFIAEESMKKQVKLPGAYYRVEEKHIIFYQK